MLSVSIAIKLNFNPRTHVGCDPDNTLLWQGCKISIHAPTWGATDLRKRIKEAQEFQSTHPRGVRLTAKYHLSGARNFNPRTHVGCDGDTTPNPFQTVDFNPRTHVGCDSTAAAKSVERPDFNPRTHVGCDVNVVFGHLAYKNFNPRTHVGCDINNNGVQKAWIISIHAPTWGATRYKVSRYQRSAISIHAPTWGATC